MSLPFFYISNYDAAQKEIVLDEETSKHIVQVLRMKKGEKLSLTDGKGNLLMSEISDAHKKHCLVIVQETINHKPKTVLTFAELEASSGFLMTELLPFNRSRISFQ